MMLRLLVVLLTLLGQTRGSATAIDVTAVKVGAPVMVTDVDLGKLKGELRRVSWAPDLTRFYLQTVEGNPPSEKLHHYTVGLDGGAIKSVEGEPDWAETYWAFKSDRAAPGIGSLMIDLEQKAEKTKVGTGSGRPGSAAVGITGGDLEKMTEGQQQNVARLTLLGETISEFVNARPIPGLMFSWGPSASGAIAYTDRSGGLLLLDRDKHKQTVSVAKDALLPAWSMDGSRLAWAQKSGRRKYALMWATVTE